MKRQKDSDREVGEILRHCKLQTQLDCLWIGTPQNVILPDSNQESNPSFHDRVYAIISYLRGHVHCTVHSWV